MMMPTSLLPPPTSTMDKNSQATTSTRKYTKPRSAYALFYEEQRNKMLLACLQKGTMTYKEVANVMDTSVKDCRHRKRNGKIGRRDIKLKVRAMWNSMSAETRDIYETAAQELLKNCQDELKAWQQEQDKTTTKKTLLQKEETNRVMSSMAIMTTPNNNIDTNLTETSTSIETMIPTITRANTPLGTTMSMPNYGSPSWTVPNSLHFMPSTTTQSDCSSVYGGCDGGSLDGYDSNSTSSEPPTMPFSCQTNMIDNSNSNNNFQSLLSLVVPQQQQQQQVSVQNYVDFTCSSSPVVEEDTTRSFIRHYNHPPLNNTNNNNTMEDDTDSSNNDRTNTLEVVDRSVFDTITDMHDISEDAVVVDTLVSQLDNEALDFLCCTFDNSNVNDTNTTNDNEPRLDSEDIDFICSTFNDNNNSSS